MLRWLAGSWVLSLAIVSCVQAQQVGCDHVTPASLDAALLTGAAVAPCENAPEATSFFGEIPTLSPAGRGSTGLVFETLIPIDSLQGRRVDPWLGFDKVQHLTFSFLWTIGTQYVLVNKASWSESGALPVSVGASAAAGLAKEYYDWRIGSRHFFSRRDLAADALGILLATGVILL